MLFRRKGRDGDTAVAERPAGAVEELRGLIEQIDALSRRNREQPEVERERELLRLRHLAGIQLAARGNGQAEFASARSEGLPRKRLPQIEPVALSPGLLRAGILRDGCLWVRGLVAPDEAARLAEEIDAAFKARDAADAGSPPEPGYYEEFVPEPQFPFLEERPWIKQGGGVWGVDSPRAMFRVLESFERAGLRSLIDGYLGEHPLMSVQKVTLRKAEPTSGGEWHQDGAFMGGVRSLNVWLSLSHCGDEAPGMDIVPRRLDRVLPTGTDGALFEWSVSNALAEEVSGDAGIVRPIFEPGDVLFFDDLFLHKTAAERSMPNPRYAVECWFFGASAFAQDFVPLAL